MRVSNLRSGRPHRGGRRRSGRLPRTLIAVAAAAVLAIGAFAWGGSDEGQPRDAAPVVGGSDRPRAAPRRKSKWKPKQGVPGNVYAHTGAGMLSAGVKNDVERIYVPNSDADTVSVIDPRKARVIDTFAVGDLPHHITPSHDLKTFYVNNTGGNSLTPIDPKTGRPKGRPIPVDDPYNLYFTPDGRSALVVAERLQRLDVRDPKTWRVQKSIPARCSGVDHMDFSADGRRAVASCEFDGSLLLLDLSGKKVLRRLRLDYPGAKPVDVRLSPDGKLFYIADEVANGVWKLDADTFRIKGFIETGRGTHGLYPSRDASVLYATNRLAGTISVIDFATGKVRETWKIPGGGSPDMGGVSADGKLLWLSGRYNAEVYAIDTDDGKVHARVPVSAGPHGMLVWPQPGRYSLGHTGNMR